MIVTRGKHWLPVIVALTLIYGLCQLGFWQLDRATQKEALLERYQSRSKHPPMDLDALNRSGADVADYSLKLHGHFLNEFAFLLDNRTVNGRVGFNVITPFATTENIILIDRGWLPSTGDRSQLPSIPNAEEEQIVGAVYIPAADAFTLQEDDYLHPQWPMLIQKIDLKKTTHLFDRPIAPYVLRQTYTEATTLVRDMPMKIIDPARNYGYAVQWFAMAAAVLLITLVLNAKHFHVKWPLHHLRTQVKK